MSIYLGSNFLAGGGSISDVQIDGTSVVSSGVANVPVMSANTLGVAKVGTNLNINNGVLSATNTTYSAGTGLSMNGTTINHTNSVTAGRLGTDVATSGSKVQVPYIDFDSEGHATGGGTHTHTITGFISESAKSKTQRGYYKFSDGLIVQWGTDSPSATNKSFPTAFSSATSYGFAVISTVANGSHLYLSAHTASTFQVKTTGDSGNYLWVAIGY